VIHVGQRFGSVACDASEYDEKSDNCQRENSRLKNGSFAAKAETVRLALSSIPSDLPPSSGLLCVMALDSNVAGADLVDANEGFRVKY
jgi:hypothetical protein